jgi:thiamine pyrophosphate-dependent acetolactate synthase large subunit-like protein
VAIAADLRDVLDGLSERIARHPAKAEREFAPLRPDEFDDLSVDGALDPRAVVRALHELLPADRAVFTDAGHFSGFPVYQMPVQSPDALGFMIDFGAVGSVLGAGAGAAIGRPERATVAFVGDGGLFMTLGELDLLVRDQVPLLVVCMNDQAYGSELVHLEESGLPPTEALFDTPDLALIAAAVGTGAERVTTIAALRSAVRGWLDGGRRGPLLLDVPITRAVRSPLYSHI